MFEDVANRGIAQDLDCKVVMVMVKAEEARIEDFDFWTSPENTQRQQKFKMKMGID